VNNLTKKIIIPTIILTLFLISISAASAAEVHINSTNNTIANVIENETPGSDNTIYLDAGTYKHSHLNGTNGIVINKNLTIIGKGKDKTIIDAQKMGKIFNVVGNSLTLINLTVTNGTSGTGGAISSTGTLTMTSCSFINNTATGNGGVIFTYMLSGLVFTSITESKFINNSATGIFSFGGAIYNQPNCILNITDSNFINNTAKKVVEQST